MQRTDGARPDGAPPLISVLVIRVWPFVGVIGFVLSIAVVILLSRRFAWQRPPEIFVADSRAWALATLVLEVLGAGLMWRPGIPFYSLFHVLLALSWVGFIAWVVSCANLVAVLRQLRPDLRLRGAALGAECAANLSGRGRQCGTKRSVMARLAAPTCP